IAGTATQNQILTASNTLADIDGLNTISYQWQSSTDSGSTWTNISGATTATFTLTDTQVGQQVRVTASYTDGHGTAESKSSTATTAVVNINDAPTGTVTVAGTAVQNQTLAASNTLADGDGLGTITYQWQSSPNGSTWTNISGATSSTFTLTETQVGKQVRAVASYTDGHGTAESVISNVTTAVVNVNDAPTGTVTVAGTATQNQILTASNTLADADGLGTIAYQWQSSADSGSTWISIGGATAATFTLTETQVGKQVRVTASYIDGHGVAESVASTGTTAVANINDAPTGTVTIAGTVTQNQVLTASNTLADVDGLAAIAYQWQSSADSGSTWTNISGATASTYTLAEAQVGKLIRVTASYTDGHGTAESKSSTASAIVANINDTPTGTVTIAGTATQNQILTASNTLADVDGLGTIAYQWQSSPTGTTWTNISGATAATYTLADAQVGKQVRVVASYTDGHGTLESVSSTATPAIVNVNDTPTGMVAVSGTATQNQVLTASNTLADGDGLGTIAYQWQSSADSGSTWANISGATAATFTLTETQVGKQVRAVASYSDGHGTAESVSSSATAAIANVNDTPTGTVTVSGTATQNQVLAANNTLADVDGLGTITYQWQSSPNGTTWTDISGATTSTFTLTDSQVGKQVRVTASYTDGHGTAESKSSAATVAVVNVNDTPTGTVTIAGTVTQNQVLTASNTLADGDGLGTIAYQWQSSADGGTTWVAISGATAATYTLAEAQVGKLIRVKASYTDGHGTLENTFSTATTAVANVNDAPTGAVIVAGTATQNQVLTASNTLADIDGLGTITYQWQSSPDGSTWTNISGATAATFTLTDTQVGKQVRVTASYTDAHGTAESVSSSATATIVNVNDTPTGSVTVSGTTTQNQVLTASNTLADGDGLGTVSYQWQSSPNGTTWTNIGGATASTFTLTETQVGKQVRAVASYTDGHGTLESVNSTATSAIANVNDAPTGAVSITGSASQSQVLTASNTLADLDGLGTITYQWQSSPNGTTWTNISGATASTFTLTATQVGKQVRVVASYTDGHSTAESVASSGTTAVSGVNSLPTGTVTISGTVTQNQLLTAGNTLADADGLGTIAYQWQSSADSGSTWTNISGATASTYTLAEAQVGKLVRVTASYTDGHGTAESKSSTATAAVANINDTPTGTVTVAGTVTQNQILTASNTLADADGLGTITYQWQSSPDGSTWTNISGATASTFTLTETQVGKQVRAVASYTDGHGTSESVNSTATSAVANVNDAPTGAVSVSGTPIQNQVLAASNTLVDADGLGTITYQWQSSPDGSAWTNISGATAAIFTLTDAQVGKQVRVTASYTDGHGTPESINSTATPTIANINDAPTGSVTVSGTATQNQVLTASNTLADADGLGTITYQWQSSADGIVWVDINGATASSYTLAEAQVGKLVRVKGSYTDGHGTAERVTSTATSAIANVNDAPTGSVTLNGTPTQNQVLTVSNTLADADGLGTISYQWQSSPDGSTWTNISGATSSIFTLTETQVNKQVRAVASYTDGHGTSESIYSSATSAITNVNDSVTGAVTITGTATQNQVLTASNTLADADGLGTITYQWQSSADGGSTWTNINGATANTYTLAEAEVGKLVQVTASYTDGHGTVENVTSTATSAVVNVNDAPTGAVTIAGTATQNQILTASNTLADADGLGTISYQWQSSADGGTTWSNISGATASTYTLAEAQVGKLMRANASYTDGHGTTESINSSATASIANVNDAPTGAVSVSGTATQNQVLTASNTLADADGLGTIAYQWQSSADGGTTWTNISGATASSYTLTEAQVGKLVRANASYTDGHGTAESLSSAATAAIANVNDAPTGSVTLSGTATQNQVLTASNSIADADGLGTITYQWQSSPNGTTWTNITGATASTFTLAEAQVGKQVRAVASYTDSHGTAESVNSSATSAIANVNDAPTGAVSVSGTATQSQVLTASNTLADLDGLGTISYQWQSSPNGTTWTNISGATSSTFTLTATQVGKQVRVIASYTDGHSTAESVNSTATAAVVSANSAPTGAVSIAGTATQNQLLTASNTLADADGLGTIAYQWQSSADSGTTWTSISGATASTFTLTEAQVGKQVRAVAAYTDGHGVAESVSSTATTTIANANDAPSGAVTVAGTATQNQVLTASNTLADADGLGTISYQWQSSPDGSTWTNISGATASTFTLTETQVGKQVRAVASYTDGHSTAESVISNATAAIANVNDAPTGAVSIAGTATQSQVLTASNTLADVDGLGSIDYQWQSSADGSTWANISGATASTFTLADAQVGKQVRVVASYTDGHSTLESVASTATAAIANVNDAPTGSVVLNGNTVENQVLTASNTLADADGLGAITYQWQSSADGSTWNNISGAADSTFTLTNTQVGKQVRAVASYTDGHGTAESVVSNATTVINGFNASIIYGTSDNDTLASLSTGSTIYGLDGDDYLAGSAGNDILDGGAGNDYIGDNYDGVGSNNILRGGDGNDTIYADRYSSNVIEGGSGDDNITIYAASDSDESQVNLITGGTGNDTIVAGGGSDTYVFNRGDGTDSITDIGTSSAGTPGSDTIVFGAGIVQSDLHTSRVGNNLIIQINDPNNPSATDQITITSWYTSDDYRIEAFQFADGSSISKTQMTIMGNAVYGTSGNDNLSSLTTGSTVYGLDGDDLITGSAGDDILDGGAGDDYIGDNIDNV
ncbi:MAG TPA: calcium-binding protein, partial [Methylophilaceae bacterium]